MFRACVIALPANVDNENVIILVWKRIGLCIKTVFRFHSNGQQRLNDTESSGALCDKRILVTKLTILDYGW